MPSTPTIKYGFVTEADADALLGAPGRLRTLAAAIDSNMAGYAEGTIAAIPAAGKSGRLYRATDTGQLFIDTGSAWVEFSRATVLAEVRLRDEIVASAESLGNGSNANQGQIAGQHVLRAGGFLAYCDIDTGTQAGTPNGTTPFATFYWDPTRYALTGRTTKWRLRSLAGPGAAVVSTATIGVHRVTNWRGSSSLPIIELDDTPTVSTSHNLNSVAYGTQVSGLVDAPASAGIYAFGCLLSAGLGASNIAQFRGQLAVTYDA
jgi:hypothetical protein